VPVGPGSSADTVTRFVAERTAALLGQSAYVENKPGAEQLIAVQSLLGAPADGYSVLLVSPGSMVINPLVNKELPYDPQRDLRPLVGAARATAVLVTASGSRFGSTGELLAAARSEPGSIGLADYGYSYRPGVLSLQKAAKVEFNSVPYKGASQLLNDLIGGSGDAALVDLGAALPLVRAGKLRALAVTGKARHADLPEVPTLREDGVPDYEMSVWIGYAVAAKTPEPIVHKLEAALTQVLATPEFAALAARSGSLERLDAPGPQFAALIAADTQRYRPLVQELNPQR